MNILELLPMLVQLAQTAVLTVEGIYGDKTAGKDKMTMATDAFNQVVAGVLPSLPVAQQGLGQVAAVLGSVALQSAYLITKANGKYAAATQVANAATAPVTPQQQ